MKMIKLFVVTVAVCLGMKFIFPATLPFLIALVLARLLYPLAKGLERKCRFHKAAARFAAYGMLLIMLGTAAAGILYLCIYMGEECLSHMDDITEAADALFCECCSRLEQVSGFETEEIQRSVNEGISSFGRNAIKYSKEVGFYMAGLLAKIFVALIASFLILNDYEHIVGAIKRNRIGKNAFDILRNIKTAFGSYLRAQICIMGIVTAVCIGGLFLLGISSWFWIGIAVGVFDALPFFGTGTIFVPWALVSFLFGNYKRGIGLFVLYIICNFIREILEPRLVGSHLGIPPVVVLMSIYFGIEVYGASGVLLGPISGLLIFEIYKIKKS